MSQRAESPDDTASSAPHGSGRVFGGSELADLLPSGVAAVETFGDTEVALFPAEGLFPLEQRVIAGAVASRRQEFATARHCARLALARFGQPAVPLLPDAAGAPLWPPDFVGSITHCRLSESPGYRAAAVAETTVVAALGIDAEPHEPLPAEVFPLVTRADERPRLAALARRNPAIHWPRLLFAAKEAVYKTWYPITGSWLDFDEVRLQLDPDSRTFSAKLLVPARFGGRPLTHLSGRWSVTQQLVRAACWLIRA